MLAGPEFLRCETGEPVDDLLVGTAGEGFAFAQVKHHVDLSTDPTSEFASAIDQFVRQYVACWEATGAANPWQRPLDPRKDRLLLVTSPSSSAAVKEHLPAALTRLRSLAPGQRVEDAAVNANERGALQVTLDHVQRSWQAAFGKRPTADEVRDLLSLLRISVLDVDREGQAEREAKDLLRSGALQDTARGDAAWATLVQACANFAQNRSGASLSELQTILLNAGIDLRASPDYRADIERLQRYTQQTAAVLANLSRIVVGRTVVKVHRRATQTLRQFAKEESLIVVGEPGAGKSGVLYDLVSTLRGEGRDVILLAADRIAAGSLSELRNELGLEHDLVEDLENWPGRQCAFLVVDALDAARADPAARAIRELVALVGARTSRWRVVASIRKFDLRYSSELQELFRAERFADVPEEFRSSEFAPLAHIFVPLFSPEELAEVEAQSPDLKALLASAPHELRELLRVPFNLRLLAGLLGEGVAAPDLFSIRTQLELLDKYWRHRVIRSDRYGDAREAILMRACDGMARARMLHINRTKLADPSGSTALNDLLSSQVLVESQPSPDATPDRYILAFSHHVLFDYAASRLLLRGETATIVDRLVHDPELALVIRPSFLMHYRHLWFTTSDRQPFWALVFQINLSPATSEISKLIGPSVAAELANDLAELGPLRSALESSEDPTRGAAEAAFQHLVGALLASSPSDRPLAGQGAGPWCDLVERVTRSLRLSTAYPVSSLLSTLCVHPELLLPEQRVAAGAAARQVLEFAWAHTPRDAWLVIQSLQAVCRTFESDPALSARLLRRTLVQEHITEFGFEEMPWLAREAKRLITLDADLVESVYRAAFGYRETSDATVRLGGRIFSLVSTRKQDYGMVLYELAQIFPNFLDTAPEHATRAVIAALEAYVAFEHPPHGEENPEMQFDFQGQSAKFKGDYSSIWDSGLSAAHAEAIQMLETFTRYVEELTAQVDRADQVRKLVRVIVVENRLAVLWRRLLQLGARFPSALGREILPLATAMPILISYDTTREIGNYIGGIFPLLTPTERERVERSILSIPQSVGTERQEYGERIRNRLLGCIPAELLVSSEARALIAELQATNAIPSNEPAVRFSGVTAGSYGEAEYLRESGVPVDAEVNKRIRDLERPVAEFADKHLNSVPGLKEVNASLPALRALRDALTDAETQGVHPNQRNYAWGKLAEACERLTKIEDLSCEEEGGSFARDVLLRASTNPDPQPNSEIDSHFDKSPSWGCPAARIDAAKGLPQLARQPSCAIPEVLQTIERLSEDPVPAVRFQVAVRLVSLYHTAQELMWSIAERLCRREASRSVLLGLLNHTLGQLAGSHPDRVVELANEVLSRTRDDADAEDVRQSCIMIFTGLYVWRDHLVCRDAIFNIVADTDTNSAVAQHIVFSLRDAVTHGPANPPNPHLNAIRHRALDLVRRILRAGLDTLRNTEERNSGVAFISWPEADQERAKRLVRLIDGVGQELYFASGAFDSRRQEGSDGRRALTDDERKRFYREAGEILDDLVDVGLPSLAHHVLKTLESFVHFDPRGVFLRVGSVVRAGVKGGYQCESLAVDLVVGIVERYLAEYRPLLQQDDECRKVLMELLDTFVKAGWPSARRLVYRLDEIFR